MSATEANVKLRVTCCDRNGHTLAFRDVEGKTESEVLRQRDVVFSEFRTTFPDGQNYFNWNRTTPEVTMGRKK